MNKPLDPTKEMLDAGAQRLVQFQDDSVWPDSWSPIQRAAARNDAEKVWRSMWLAAPAAPSEEVREIISLLEDASCPICDGSGSFARELPRGDVEQIQCQWCGERDALLTRLSGKEKP